MKLEWGTRSSEMYCLSEAEYVKSKHPVLKQVSYLITQPYKHIIP
jgi:hypothetical protein